MFSQSRDNPNNKTKRGIKMLRAINEFNLVVGKLSLPMKCYKAVEETTSVYASEVAKINGQIYKVQRKPYVILEDGSHKDIDSGQILKQYEKDDGSVAIFTKEEQSTLLKKGSSREWVAQAVTEKSNFGELDFQKDGIICMIELDKKKELENKKRLKFFAMLKEGLGEKVIVTQILYKNVEYPVVISNHQDKLLVRFLHYKDEIRQIEAEAQLPVLSAEEKEKAKAFVMQSYKPVLDIGEFENKTAEQVMKIINSKGTDTEESQVEQSIMEDNPFEM
jgi:non-homologous end joining protein Ku